MQVWLTQLTVNQVSSITYIDISIIHRSTVDNHKHSKVEQKEEIMNVGPTFNNKLNGTLNKSIVVDLLLQSN